MKKHMVLVVGCALFAAMPVCVRAIDANVGKAATDVSQISEMLAGVEDGEKATFLKQVVEAATKMPIDPEKRPEQIAAVISASLDAMPKAQMPELLSTLVCKIPFSFLPATIDAMIPGMRTRTAPMSDTEFHDALTKAVQTVRDQGLDADDADIYTSFVIALFARLPDVEDNLPVIEQAMPAVPEQSRETVGFMIEAILAGNYEAIFGPKGAEEIVAMSKDSDDIGRSEKDSTGDAFLKVDETVMIDIGLERPVIIPKGEGEGHRGGGHGGHDKPPVPPPYKGQGSF